MREHAVVRAFPHPLVCPLHYLSSVQTADVEREAFVRDKQWCERNFLHRYRLGFQDGEGGDREALAPLPADLCAAAAHLVPVGAHSAAALAEWKSGSQPKAWALQEGL